MIEQEVDKVTTVTSKRNHGPTRPNGYFEHPSGVPQFKL